MSPYTADLKSAERWMKELAGSGFDGVVAKQAIILALSAYVLAICAALAVIRMAQQSGAPIVLPAELALLLLLLAFFMSLGGALFSIRKALAVDPSLVMKL